MKAVLYIKPRKGKPHGAADLSALGFTPALTPSGLCFALEVFPRKVDAQMRMLDIAKQFDVPCERNQTLLLADDIRIQIFTGEAAADLIRVYEWFTWKPSAIHPTEQPLITKSFEGESAPL